MKPIILPEEKLDELANKVCARILSGHYFTNGVIRGEELKDFADHQQVNKFLLFQIYQTWNLQLSKLKHAYFDFSHPEVEQGLTNLRNLLSRHIQISESDFQPLLKRAIYNNIKLLLNPENSFESFFFVDNDSIGLETFSQYGPFFSDMDFIVNSILRYHQKHRLEEVEKGMFFLKMEKVIELYNQKSGISFEEYRKQSLNKLLQEDIDDILREIQEENHVASPIEESPVYESEPEVEEIEPTVVSEPPQEESNFFETVIADNNSTDFDFDLSEETLEETPIIEETVSAPIAEAVPTPEPEPYSPPQEINEIPSTPVVEEVVEEQPTYGEVLTPPSPPEPEEPIYTPAPTPIAETEVPRVEPKQASTVEEALSAFLNKEKPKKSVFDSISDEAPSEPAETPYKSPAFDTYNAPKPPVFSQFHEETNGEYHVNKPTAPANTGSEAPQTIAEKYQTQVTEEQPTIISTPSVEGGKEIKLSDIPIHRQYQYVQKVFEGNNVRFRIIVDKVNNSKNRDEVESIIDRFILSNSALNKSDEVVQEFIKMLRSRH